MKLFRGPRRKLAIAATAAAATVVVAGGAAYAWIALSDTEAVAVASATVVQPVVSEVQIAPMLPGTKRPVKFKVANPNNFPIQVKSIQVDGAITVTAPSGTNNCGVAQLDGGLTGATAVPVAGYGPQAAGNTIVEYEVAEAIGLKDTADAACGATFTLKVNAEQRGN